MGTKQKEFEKYNLFSQFKNSTNKGWVLYFDQERDRDRSFLKLKDLGIESERRHGKTGFMYFHWLIIGTPLYLCDDFYSLLCKYDCYLNQNESEWHPYNVLITDSERANKIEIDYSESAGISKPWWKFWK